MRNRQTQMLAGCGDEACASAFEGELDMYRAAVANLERADLVLVPELWDESMALLAFHFGFEWIGAYDRVAEAGGADVDDPARADAFRRAYGPPAPPAVRREVELRNGLDAALHERAKQLVAERAAQLARLVEARAPTGRSGGGAPPDGGAARLPGYACGPPEERRVDAGIERVRPCALQRAFPASPRELAAAARGGASEGG
jgi:hypothetical protein